MNNMLVLAGVIKSRNQCEEQEVLLCWDAGLVLFMKQVKIFREEM